MRASRSRHGRSGPSRQGKSHKRAHLVGIVEVRARLVVALEQEVGHAALEEGDGEERVELGRATKGGDGLLMPPARREDEADVEVDARRVGDLLEEPAGRARQRSAGRAQQSRPDAPERSIEVLRVVGVQRRSPLDYLGLERHCGRE